MSKKAKERIKDKSSNWKGGVNRFVSISMKRRVLERDNYECQECGLKMDLAVHHKIDYKEGGKTIDENLITLCRQCHMNKHGGKYFGRNKV